MEPLQGSYAHLKEMALLLALPAHKIDPEGSQTKCKLVQGSIEGLQAPAYKHSSCGLLFADPFSLKESK